MKQVRKIIRILNLPRVLCQRLLGEEHPLSYRFAAGFSVMAVGVAIAKVGGGIHAYGLHYAADLIGYAVHGLGAVPMIEWLIREEEHVELVVESLSWPELEQ